MAAATVEERIALLEKTVKEQQDINEKQATKIQRLEDVHEIANLMGRYVWLHEVQRDPEFIDTLYAQKTPGLSWEVAHMGLYKGREAVRKILKAHGPRGEKPAPGTLFLHTLTSPVIEVAGDGKTAKGVWVSPGAEAMGSKGFWAWTKYGVDFVREDGKWKIWHYHVYRIFMTPVGTDYTEEYELKMMAKGTPGGGMPAIPEKEPTTYDNPYSKQYVPELVPAPPDPYETWDSKTTYGPLEE